MPYNGYTGCMAVADTLPSGWLYMRKHVPWPDFTDLPGSVSIVYPGPLKKPPSQFTWITPNMCNDMHDCSVATGDDWLAANVPTILGSLAYNSGGALFITWDEGEGGDGPIGMIVMSPLAKPGFASNTHTDHSSYLKTVQEIFRVTPLLGHAADAATNDLSDLFTSFP